MLLAIYFYVSRGTYLTYLLYSFILFILCWYYFLLSSLYNILREILYMYIYERCYSYICTKKNILLKLYGDEGYRSPCPSHAKRMLYHMSYIPFSFLYSFILKMHPVGFEPTHLSIAVLETAPLDHSGTNASFLLIFLFLSFYFYFRKKKIL